MSDLVYIVGGPPDGADRIELRFSLRSFAANWARLGTVWIAGDIPRWVSDDARRLPLRPLPNKSANQRQSITAYVNHPDAAESFWLANDDFFLTEPVESLPTCRSDARASGWLAAQEREGRKPNGWHRGVLGTAEWVAARLGADPWIYEQHTPILFDTARMRDVLAAYPVQRHLELAGLYPLAGCGGEGEACGNAKVKRGDDLAAKLAQNMPYLSLNPETWNGQAGLKIRGMFPRRSRFEKG